MSRHRHPEPFEYDNFRSSERGRQPNRSIEYQDDSASPINSDEESYLQHLKKKQSSHVYSSCKPSISKPMKSDKNERVESNVGHSHLRDREHVTSSETSKTNERLDRLEKMLEELIKQRSTGEQTQTQERVKQKEKEDSGFCLEPRKHSFTTSMWINHIEEVSVLNNWNEKSTIQYMEGHISGIIKAWYNNLPTCDFTWPEWKILMSKTFPDNTDFVTTLKRLVTRIKQQDETMTNYYFSKMYLIEACKITGEDAVSCLIDGLNNQGIQVQAKAQNFLTPETLYSQYLMALPDYVVDYTPFVAQEKVSQWYYPEADANGTEHQEQPVQNVDYKENEVEITTGYELRYEPPQDVQMNPYEGEKIQPFEIKRTGPVHSRLDKKFIKTQQFKQQQQLQQQQSKRPMTGSLKICSICFKRGHLARYCRKAKSVVNYCTSQEGKSKLFTERVIKQCFVNNRETRALIDTGCSSATIKSKYLKKFGLTCLPSSEVLHGYGGGLVEVVGEVEVDFRIDNVSTRLSLLVVSDEAQEFPVIIGQNLISKNGIGMILQNRTLHFYDSSLHSFDISNC